jgi:hypothetical protein
MRNATRLADDSDGFELDPRYQAARHTLSALRPDLDWLTRYQRIPDELVAERVSGWLAEIGAPPMGQGGRNERRRELSERYLVHRAPAGGVKYFQLAGFASLVPVLPQRFWDRSAGVRYAGEPWCAVGLRMGMRYYRS